MNVLVVEPGYLPYEKEVRDELKDLQEIVGGNIQAIYPFRDRVALVCNENGIAEHLAFNRMVPERQYGAIFGTFFLCGLGEESFTSLTSGQMRIYKKRFEKAEVLLAVNGGKPIVAKAYATPRRPPDGAAHPPKRHTR